MRTAAAQWELEGPRMTGPITSLKILGKELFIFTFSMGKVDADIIWY
jgi:hypothetical protein